MQVKIEQTADGKRLQDALNKLTNVSAKVGWLGGQPYPDGTPVAQVAIDNEYGVFYERIPPRPFMRPTISKHEKQWANQFEIGSRKILKDEITIDQLFGLVASEAAGQIKQKITEIFTPPLATATIYARVRKRANKTVTESLTKPLIDTGHMIQSITYIVEKS